jgi:hypothetical protein
MEQAIGIGAAQDAEAGFGLRVRGIGGDDERLVEENLLGLATSDIVFDRVFGEVACIPFETGVSGGIDGHGQVVYMSGIYTSRPKPG